MAIFKVLMRFALILIALLICKAVYSQKADTIYLNGFRERSNIASADYYRVAVKINDNFYSITDYSIKDDVKRMTGYQSDYLSGNPIYNMGTFTYYDSTGRKEMEGQYIDGKMNGTWTFYRNGGTIMIRVNMVNNEKNGAAEMYDFQNGKMIAEGRYYINRKVGEWKYYEPYTGILGTLAKYDGYGIECDVFQYDTESSKVLATYHLFDGSIDGIEKIYYRGSERLRFSIEYNEGFIDGEFYEYDSLTQSVIRKGSYKRNNKTGEWKTYYNDTNKLKMVEHFEIGELEGETISYDIQGRIIETHTYKSGKKDGLAKVFYPGLSQVWIECNYKDDSLDGNLIAYHRDGKIKRQEVYNTGLHVSATCYDANGKLLPCKPFISAPLFSKDLNSYLKDSIQYPLSAKLDKIEGTVVVRFAVNENGYITDVEILKGLNQDCDLEALRLISKLPISKPGQRDEQPYKSYMTMPVQFKLK